MWAAHSSSEHVSEHICVCVCLHVYLPGATNALKEIRHPHGQNHCFSQQLLSIFQISNVIPTVHPENSVSSDKKKNNSLAAKRIKEYVRICVCHHTSARWGYGTQYLSPVSQPGRCHIPFHQTFSALHPPVGLQLLSFPDEEKMINKTKHFRDKTTHSWGPHPLIYLST